MSGARRPGLRHCLDQRGVTLIVVLVALVVLGLSAGIAGRTWSSLTQQEREEELLFRGDQYRRAIASFYQVKHGSAPGMYPNKLEDLLRDPRSLQTRRHLRRLYQDPFGGGDFVPIRQGSSVSGLGGSGTALGGIKGVQSGSSLQPFKQDGFAKEYEGFRGAARYEQWQFVFEPPAETPPAGAGTEKPAGKR